MAANFTSSDSRAPTPSELSMSRASTLRPFFLNRPASTAIHSGTLIVVSSLYEARMVPGGAGSMDAAALPEGLALAAGLLLAAALAAGLAPAAALAAAVLGGAGLAEAAGAAAVPPQPA